MKNEERILEVLAESLKGQDRIVKELQEPIIGSIKAFRGSTKRITSWI